MPTGYTAKLMEKGQTFKEFVLTCARSSGALVMMHNDSMDAPIPEKFEPSDYNFKELEKATELLIRLKRMTNDKKISFGQLEKDKKIKQLKKWLKKEEKENVRLNEMNKLCTVWVPPTPDHQWLKEFMLQQIDVSKSDCKYIMNELDKAENKSPLGYYISSLSDATRDINYHKEKNEKEIERVNIRNEWIKQLRLSI